MLRTLTEHTHLTQNLFNTVLNFSRHLLNTVLNVNTAWWCLLNAYKPLHHCKVKKSLRQNHWELGTVYIYMKFPEKANL